MTCGETREYLFAFLDNELDAPLSIELQRHLEACAVCARDGEIEQTIRRRLVTAIEATGEEVPDCDACLEAALAFDGTAVRTATSPYSRRWFRRGGILTAAAALAFLASAGVWTVLSNRAATRSASGFAGLAVADFEHFLREGGVVQVASADREEVAVWLRKWTSLAVVLPIVNDPRCTLVGGRKCVIDGRPAAFAVYDMSGAPASLVALAAQPRDLAGMEAVRLSGAVYRMYRDKGYTVVACQRGELLYAAVSTLPQEDLLCLLSEALHESD